MSKDKVLEILEKNRGKTVSGEFIAKTLGISRASVCKDISKLREEGNEIYSRTNAGYMLDESSPALSAAGIKSSMRIPREVVYRPVVDSTNVRAKIMAAEGASDGTVVAADSQTSGHGRRGRNFYSPPGKGVYFSLILRPGISYMLCRRVVPLAAVAVSRAVKTVCRAETQIKWANDIYFRGRKAAGICTESIGQLGADAPDALIVGIGINVLPQEFPAELDGKAGSLGTRVSRNALIAQCVECIYELLPQISSAEFMDEYRQKCFTLGREVTVYADDKPQYRAKAVRIDDDGVLFVEKSDGSVVPLITEEASVKAI